MCPIDGLLLVLVFVGQCWQLHICSSMVFCTVDFNIQHNREAGRIEISTQWNSDVCRQNQLPVQPYLAKTGVQPLVQMSNCRKRVTTINSTLSIGHTLVAIAQMDNISWSLEIPEYLSHEVCIEIIVKGTTSGPAMQLAEIRRQLWIGTSHQTMAPLEDGMICSGCEIVDSSTFDWINVALVKDTTEAFSLLITINGHTNSTVDVNLPGCVQANGSLFWTSFNSSEGCEEHNVIFIPMKVNLASKNDVFVTGNGILYSPNRGVSWYQLSAAELDSFTSSRDGNYYVFIHTQNESIEVWLGFIGSSELIQVYPNDVLETLYDIGGGNMEATNITVAFDDQSVLHIVEGNTSHKLPLSLLIQNSLFQASSCNSMLTNSIDHPLLVTGSTFHQLTTTCRDVCPFSGVRISAPLCGSVTRSKFHLVQDGFLRWVNESIIPEVNCDVLGNSLPGDIFLGQSQSYRFTVELFVNPDLPDPSGLFLVKRMSDLPEIVDVQIRESFHSQLNVLAYEIFFQEQKHFEGQYEPGYTMVSVDMDFEVLGANTKCQDTSSIHTVAPGHLQTRVHIGCPPGLSLHFNMQSTSSQYNQYCTPADGINCYYFGNEFHPVFEIIDSVTEERRIYNGVYTLKALQGGTKATNMRSLSHITNVESSIWTPVNESKNESPPRYHYRDNGIQWVCSTTGPCGEIFPLGGRTPEYYLLLEASNREVAENDTYCEFTVQFQIKLHGMGMGAITLVGTLLFFHILVILTVISMFVTWHYRLKFFYWKDLIMEQWTGYSDTHNNVITKFIRKQRAKSLDVGQDIREAQTSLESTQFHVG